MAHSFVARGRSAGMSIRWHALGAVITSAIVFAITRQWTLSLLVGAIDLVVTIGMFWMHQRVVDGKAARPEETRPSVLWFTGLSGSGKSTIAEQVTASLREQGLQVEHLDGDSVRAFFPSTGFSRVERDAHIRRVGFLASRLEANGVFVVASFVSPYQDSRDFVRGLCHNFVEVYVNTPLEVCERRDVKGLYAKARRGEIAHFTGISDPYEPPSRPELVIDTTVTSVDIAVSSVMLHVQRQMNATT